MALSPELEHLNAILGGSKTEGGYPIQHYLTFSLGNEEYGVDIHHVQEIKSWGTVTSVPNTPDYLCGLFNLRSEIVPIIDLRLRFGMVKKEYGPMTIVIILKVTDQQNQRDKMIGIVVDAVSDTYSVKLEDIKPIPDFGLQVNTAYMKGLVAIADNMMMILDVEALLSAEALA